MTQDQLTPTIDSSPTEYIDPLHLDLNDSEFVQVVRDNITASIDFYTKDGLYEKQKKNVDYYYGKQKLDTKGKRRPYMENIIYEGISRIKPIALSRMPDLMVEPGNDSSESKENAEKLSRITNSDIKKRKNRKLMGLANKQEPLYYFAPVKAVWNPSIGEFGDYEFVNVHPKNIVFDHTATTNEQADMRFIAEKRKITIKEIIMTFPEKEAKIKAAFGWTDEENVSDETKLATKDDCWEIWFDWSKRGNGNTWEKISGVMWMYKKLVLKKMKNPYFDFQGKKRQISFVLEEKQAISMDDLFGLIDQQKGIETPQTVYNNYFTEPEKPYFFMVYENMGEHPIGATSRVEQVLLFQDSINQTGADIQDMNRRSRGKDIFDTNAIDQKTLDMIDIYDVDQVLGINVPSGRSIRDSHARIEQMPATQQMYKSKADDRQKAFEMLAVGATTRGVRESGDMTLGESQMLREADYGVIDDIVEDTINALAEWQARWSMQFIKLFYTKPHMRNIIGKDGDILHESITNDLVEDGMEVVVSASGVDKLQRKRVAIENAKLGLSDPLTFFEDTEQQNPKERAKRAMMFKVAPQLYMQEYLMDGMGPDNPAMPGIGQPPAPIPTQLPS